MAQSPSGARFALPTDRRSLLILQLLFALLVFGAWEIYGRLRNPLIFPPFTDVARAFVDLVTSGRLFEALWPSLKLLTIGFSIAMVIGLVLGIIIGRSRIADMTFSPYISALYATPEIALVPIILVWFGFGLSGRVVVVVIASVFTMLYNVTAGVRNAPEDLIDVARSFGASRARVLFQVILPSAIPFIMAGIRLSIGRAVVGMAVAEVYLRLGGIGELITAYGSRFVTDYLMASILVLPLLGIGLTKLLAAIERRIAPWKTV